MERCKKCGQDLEINDKFCRNCGQAVDSKEKPNLSEETIVPKDLKISKKTREEDTDSNVLDLSLIEKAREEKIKKEIEETLNPKEDDEDREYKDYELAKTQVIGDINKYLDEDEESDYDDDYDQEEEDYDYYYEEKSKGPRKHKDKKKLYMGIGIGLLILVIIASIFFLKSKKSMTKDELIEDFITSLSNRDEDEILRILKSPNPEMKIDKMGIEAYFTYIDENPSYIDKLRFELEEQSKFYDKNNRDDIGERFENVVLRNKNGEFTLEIKPYYMNVKVANAGIELFLNDNKLDSTTSDNYQREFGPFMPGIYTLKGQLISSSDEFVEEKVSLFDENPDTGKVSKDVELDLQLVSLKLESDYPDAMLIINGEKTNTRLKDLENGILGPLPKSTKIAIAYNTPFGEVKSRELSLGEAGEVLRLDLDFATDGIMTSLMEAVNQFIKDDAKAREVLDPSIYTNLTEPELSRRINMILEMKDLNQSVESSISKIVYDLNSYRVKRHEGKYYASVAVKIEVEELLLTDFSTEKVSDVKYGNYISVYDENKKTWLISDVEENSNFNMANVKEFKL